MMKMKIMTTFAFNPTLCTEARRAAKEKKDLCGIWTAKTDLAILRIDNDLKVVPIYEAFNHPQIACVKKGSALETDKITTRKLYLGITHQRLQL